MEQAIVTMRRVRGSPTFPRTQPNRRYMMTPRIVRIEGVKTPLKVPNWYPRVSGDGVMDGWGSGSEGFVTGSTIPVIFPQSRKKNPVFPGRENGEILQAGMRSRIGNGIRGVP